MFKQKTMDQEVANKVRELKSKDREEKRSRRFQDTLTLAERTTQRIIENSKKSTLIKHGLLLHLRLLLVTVSTTILKQDFEPIL
jgi:hypothetical protein